MTDTTVLELQGLRNLIETSLTHPDALKLTLAGRAYDTEPVTDEEFARQLEAFNR